MQDSLIKSAAKKLQTKKKIDFIGFLIFGPPLLLLSKKEKENLSATQYGIFTGLLVLFIFLERKFWNCPSCLEPLTRAITRSRVRLRGCSHCGVLLYPDVPLKPGPPADSIRIRPSFQYFFYFLSAVLIVAGFLTHFDPLIVVGGGIIFMVLLVQVTAGLTKRCSHCGNFFQGNKFCEYCGERHLQA